MSSPRPSAPKPDTRTYTDRDLERLLHIARAKDLGCTLDEIADLVRAWDDDERRPVKHRLRSLVDAKVRAVDGHLAEQAAFAAQLRATAAGLADRPLDGPCDDTCGCTTETDVPIACSLSAGDVGRRVDEWQAVLAYATERHPVPGDTPPSTLRLRPRMCPIPAGSADEGADASIPVTYSARYQNPAGLSERVTSRVERGSPGPVRAATRREQ